MTAELPQIRTGRFDHPMKPRDYRLERLGDMLVERAVWLRPLSDAGWLAGATVCYRFWLPAEEQVVERYFARDGEVIGTHVDLCSPPQCDGTSCAADDYLLDIRIAPSGEVTIHNERAFEEALASGRLALDAGRQAERHLRTLTAAIARGRFPPPIVRNWQLDPSRLPSEDP